MKNNSNRFESFFPLARKFAAWFTIGLGLKRWLVGLFMGAIAFGAGFVLALFVWAGMTTEIEAGLPSLIVIPLPILAALLFVAGSGLSLLSLWRLWRTISDPFRRPDERIIESIYYYQMRNKGPKIVAIGGGTGSSTVLRGLTQFTNNITAIVTVADDGGSSGRLRREFGVLPPGDFRNNIAALSRDERLMTQLLQYRFGTNLESTEESGLQGHAFGNLLIMALVGLTGSFEDALRATRRVLALRGDVYPSTLTPINLVADVELNGRLVQVEGESMIPKAKGRINRVYISPDHVRGYPAATQAILAADLVILGPGSLYTSIIPNILVRDIAQALRHTNATVVYVCNIATQTGETDTYSLSDHVSELSNYLELGNIDVVLGNSNFSIPTKGENKNTVYVQYGDIEQDHNVKFIARDLVDELRPWRHDSHKLAAALVDLIKS